MKKISKIPLRKKDLEAFFSSTMSARRRTTTDFNRLLYLMSFFFFALIEIFYDYNNIYSIV